MIARLHRYLSGSSLGPVLVKTISGSAGLRIAGMGFGFLVGVQLARGLGAEGYGIYGLAMSIISLLTVPTEFGLPQLLTREVAAAQVKQEWGRLKGILHWSSRVSLLIASIVAVGVVAWLLGSGRGLTSPLGLTLLAGVVMIPITSQLSLFSGALRGLQQIVSGQLADVLLRPMLHSLLLFVVSISLASFSPALAMGLGAASAMMALVFVASGLRKALPAEARSAARIIDSQHWRSSALPMAMTEGMRLLQGNLLILLLGWMVTLAEVGHFRIASSVALLIGMPISLFNIVCMPMISRLHSSGDREKLKKLIGIAAAGMTLGTLALFLPFFIAGETLLGHIFGAEFSESNDALLILSLSMLINAGFGIPAAVLNMTGHQRTVTRASLLSLCIMAITSIPLTLHFGILGAAAANMISVLAWNMHMWLSTKKYLGFDTSVLSLVAFFRTRKNLNP